VLVRFLSSAIVLTLSVCASAAGQTPPAAPAEYVWAAACKDCHKAYYESWDKTKHAHAIGRLSSSERQAGSSCIGCHVTGAKELAEKDVNANIQCEGCHGPGSAHIAAAAGGAAKPGAIARKPAESVCTACHSDKSPHFKFFTYAGLAPLVHPISK
jgi:nitrate/TMAO reductase-like tetraheme cytochrome c subunit